MHKLKQAYFHTNELKALRSDLFLDTPSLAFAVFDANSINHVADGTFDHLSLLTNLHFQAVGCINTRSHDRSTTTALITSLRTSCPPSTDMIAEHILKGEEFQRRVDKQITKRMINPVGWSAYELVARMKLLEDRVRRLESNKTTIAGNYETF